MPFTNRVRLPFKLNKPQFPEERQRYRKSNGVTVTLSVVIRKVYEGITDYMPEKLHERLKIALSHDNVQVEGDRYVGVISQEGSYDIEWSDFKDRPTAQAKFKAEVTPFNATNSNCGTCEQYSQVVAENDDVGTLDEDTTYIIDVLENDSICCFPITVSVVSFDSTYLVSATVNDQNEIVIQTKPLLPDVNSITLVTYKVECDNGMYDEADIIGNIDGTDPTPVCLAPTNAQLVSLDSDTSASFSWDAPSPAPSCGYHWEVRNLVNLVAASGDTSDTDVQVTGLPSNSAAWRFYVRSNCCSLDSNYAGPVHFSLPPPPDTESCGQYELFNTVAAPQVAQYLDCNGDEQTEFFGSFSVRQVCALQSSPGNPVDMVTSSNITVTYLGLC